LAQAGVIRAPVHELVLLLGNVTAAVPVQLERQGGHPGSGQGGASYTGAVLGATGWVRATKSPPHLQPQHAKPILFVVERHALDEAGEVLGPSVGCLGGRDVHTSELVMTGRRGEVEPMSGGRVIRSQRAKAGQ